MPRGKKVSSGKSRKSKAASKAGASISGANGAVDNEALNSLAAEYKSFKKENPAKAARVPTSIKGQARKLHDSGETYSSIAEACGLTLGSVRAWLEGPAAKAGAVGKPGRKPGRPVQGASSGKLAGWVKIRVEGREVEVAKGDFWDLLKGGLEADQ